ncbi:hypothetical protein F5878DRAFT_646021 [Lentinula raphanica]|uniref:Uncharacterized protein n=1 Tax=Lentinula raphanica TaxID=153919 RepID=A0AA38NZE1_9AGAR|nr:hypothetical protein F5878DRAFT_646021 [Lentinula raphanica]
MYEFVGMWYPGVDVHKVPSPHHHPTSANQPQVHFLAHKNLSGIAIRVDVNGGLYDTLKTKSAERYVIPTPYSNSSVSTFVFRVDRPKVKVGDVFLDSSVILKHQNCPKLSTEKRLMVVIGGAEGHIGKFVRRLHYFYKGSAEEHNKWFKLVVVYFADGQEIIADENMFGNRQTFEENLQKEEEEEEEEEEHFEVKRTRSKRRKAPEDSASRPPRQVKKGDSELQPKTAATRTSRKPTLVAQNRDTQHLPPPPLKRDAAAAPAMALQPVKTSEVKTGPLPSPPLKHMGPSLVVPHAPAVCPAVRASMSTHTQRDDKVLKQGWKILKEYLSGSSKLSTQPLVEAELANLFGSDVAMQAPWQVKIAQITGLEPDDIEQRQALLHEIDTAIIQFSHDSTPPRIEKRSRSGRESPILRQSPDHPIASSLESTGYNIRKHSGAAADSHMTLRQSSNPSVTSSHWQGTNICHL